MAKELPYYQFEPAEHLAGDIQMCSLAAQGLFCNIKSVYWIKECKLTLRQVQGRFKHPELIEELIENEILKIENGNVCIEFLDSQFNDILDKKNKLSEAGKKGWLAKKKKATLKPPLNEVKAPLKQLDKIREDNKNNIYAEFIKLFNGIAKKNYRGCSKSKRLFKDRIKDGYKYEDFEKAIINLYADDYHKENSFKWATPEFILRSDKIEMYLNKQHKSNKYNIV